jgi:hypothetical protein
MLQRRALGVSAKLGGDSRDLFNNRDEEYSDMKKILILLASIVAAAATSYAVNHTLKSSQCCAQECVAGSCECVDCVSCSDCSCEACPCCEK